jgi:NitT/TauT family transport system ATP-binding protein
MKEGNMAAMAAAAANTPATLLDFQNVTVAFGSRTVMGPTTLSVSDGEFLAIVGPSGCGKSTLLNLAAGMLFPSSGQVAYRGTRINQPNRDVGYVTQKNYCLPWRNVRQNIMLPLEFRGLSRPEAERMANDAIRQVGLAGSEDAYPNQLSGGMLQRVMIARTLVYRPNVYLMDEPFGSLDAQLRMKMHAELLGLWQRTKAAFIFVTHDLHEAITLADRVVVMSQRPGRIKLDLPIQLKRPRDVVDVQADPEFGSYFKILWSALDVQS